MRDELAFAMITPYSLAKSRTGGIIGRLISQTDLDFCGARMYAPSDRFVDEYLSIRELSTVKGIYRKAFDSYIDQNFRAAKAMERGITNRFMLLLFRGPRAVEKLYRVVGSPTARPVGNTVRGTYGDCIVRGRQIEYFEPAVLTAADPELNRATLALLSRYAERDGGVVEKKLVLPKRPPRETTLVMLKPDNFLKRSSRPGNIIDMFSKTGLTIVGARLFQMTVEQGMRFYGFLEKIFVDKLRFLVERKLAESLEGAFDFPVGPEDYAAMSSLLARRNAHCEVNKIIEFMTGRNPDATPAREWHTSGATRCLALLYNGPQAIAKIRDKLGPTDPNKAEGGTVRSDYGRDLMKNGAHASDSLESATRERPIVGLRGGEKSDEKRLIDSYLKGKL